MIRAALLTLAVVAATSAGHAFADPGREVIHIDQGAGHQLVIVRDQGGWNSGQGEVLAYTDASGAEVRVYGDHPVTRDEVEARLREAEREGERARQAGLRAQARGMRAAAEGERAAVRAEIEADRARIEGERAADAARARAEAAEARAEAVEVSY